MAEFSPLARSPITPPSTLVRAGWEVSDASSRAALRIADCTPLAKILVRAQPDGAAASTLGAAHGRTRRSDQGVLVIGSSPGEWTLIGDANAGALAERACEADPDAFTSIIDQTHGRALIRLTGERSKDLLAKLCGIDLHESVTPNGTAFRSSVAKVVTDVARDDLDGVRCYLLHCERSSGQYLFDALFDAGLEFDIELDSSD